MDFFLLHGGWQGGWCWDAVANRLRQAGHRVHAPTMPGFDPGSSPQPRLGLRNFVAHAVEAFDSCGFSEAVVIGHSGGGPVGQGLVEHRPDRVRLIGFMDATVLFDGETLFDVADPQRAVELRRQALANPEGLLPMTEKVWLEDLCCDVDAAVARVWLERTVPTPIGWATQPAETPNEAWRRLGHAYIFLDEEKPSAKPLYERMAARLVDPAIIKCPGSHEAMLTRPDNVARALLDIAQR